jgi:methanogenic corrinoid protein MtbC1/predicted metal-binding protein
MTLLEDIAKSIEEGKIRRTKELVKLAVDGGTNPRTVLNDGLLNGLRTVGRRFDRDSFMVSDMLVSSRCINESMEILKPMLLPPGGKPIGRGCIGTVRGDLHDVGKNIVRLMLESRGIEILDLGVDVPPETFVRAVKEDGCELVCCSALLTATMPELGRVIRALRDAKVRDRVIVMVGGVPVTAAYAKRIGADFYSEDGFAAAEKAERALLALHERKKQETGEDKQGRNTAMELKALAKECGFTVVEDLDPKTLKFMPEVRDMCAADKCRHYNRSWSCPPACGTLEEWTERASKYSKGIIMQTVGDIEDTLDFEAIMQIAQDNAAHFNAFADAVLAAGLDCLPLSVGGCTRCKECTYPDAPCRFPDRCFSSMEATGLMVNQVCTDNGVPYNYGKGKMAYTSCLLYNE